MDSNLAIASILCLTVSVWAVFMLLRLCEANKALLQTKLEQEAQANSIATLTHEIRTPLNGVIGMLNLTAATKCSPEQKTYLGHATASARNLLSMLDETLDQAKAEKIGNTEVNISHLLESVAELLSPRAHAKNTEIATYIDPQLPETIAIDETKLRQLLYNLAGNAIKFTNIGGVSLSAQSSKNGGIKFKVADTGIGMDENEKAKLFQAFAQANHTVSRKFGGSGLGLAISQTLTKELGGSLEFDSQPDQGTNFTITLPFNIEPKSQSQPLLGRHFTLCMANGFGRDYLQNMLEDSGAKVSLAENPKHLFVNVANMQTTYICGQVAFTQLKSWAKSRLKNEEVWVVLTPEMRHTEPRFLKSPFAGYLLLPLRRETLIAQLSRKQLENLKTLATKMQKASQPRKQHVFLAEDNQINALIAQKNLSQLGYRVTHVTNGTEAKKRLTEKNQFTFALLDLDMPGLSGIEVTQAVRDQEKINNRLPLPIFAFSATQHHVTLQKALSAGMSDIITKPIDLDEFNRKLTQHNLLQFKAAA